MKLNWFLPLFLCLVYLLAASTNAEPRVAIRGVTIVDVVEGSLVPDQTVLITGTRIRAIGSMDTMPGPPDAEVVEGAGKYLIPGLADMHVHLFNNGSRRPPDTWAFPLFIANGVTAVREMWTEPASMPMVKQWRRSISEGELLAPRILAAGALIDGPGAPIASMPTASTPAEGRKFVDRAAKAGVGFIKVYSHLAPAVYRAITDEARTMSLPVAGHIPLQIRAAEAARAGQRTNEHLYQIREACTPIEGQLIAERRRFYAGPHDKDEEYAFLDAQVHRTAEAYDEPACERIAQTLIEARQWQVPTLINERRWFLGVPRDGAADPRLTYLPPSERAAWLRRVEAGDVTYSGDPVSLRRGWEKTLRVVGVLGRRGVGFLVGTDFGQPFVFPGASVHKEMELLVKAGLSPLQALQAATINPARYLQLADSMGTVETGKLAHLVLLDANPLDSISNTQRIRAVIVNGRLLRRTELDAILAGVLASYGSDK